MTVTNRNSQENTTFESNSALAFMCLVIYVFFVFVRPHQMFELSYDWSLVKIFALSALIFMLILQRPLHIASQHVLAIMLLPVIVLSGFLNSSGTQGIDETIKFLASSLIPMFLVSNMITTKTRFHTLIAIFFLTVILMVHNGHYQQINIDGWALNTHYVEDGRITYLGFFNDPNDIGMFFVMTIPLMCYSFVRGGAFIKLISLLLLSVNLYGISLTGSEGTMLGAAAICISYYIIVKRSIKFQLFIVSLLPIFMIAFVKLMVTVDQSAYGRLYAWYDGIQMLLSSPLTGIGKGRFFLEHGLTAHNSFILVASELGIIGYSLWGGVLLYTLMVGYHFIRAFPKAEYKELDEEKKQALQVNKTIFFSLIGFVVTAFFLSRSYSVVYYVFLGLAIASHYNVIKLIPELKDKMTGKLLVLCTGLSWSLIIMVYVALKIAL